jgi:hypothetical protein
MTEHADSTRLSATYVVTADDLVTTSRFAGRNSLPMIYISAAAVVAFGAMYVDAPLGWPLIGLGVAIGALPMLPGLWRWWLTRRARSLVGEERHFVFDEEGFHEERAGIRHTTPWNLLSVMRITRDGVFLLRDGHLVLALPARAFATPDDLDRLIGLVSAASRMGVASE